MRTTEKTGYVLASAEELDLIKTFECGQCFRWNADESGVYSGAACGKALKIWEEDGRIICSAKNEDVPFWRYYFDLDVDYKEKSLSFTEPSYLKKCSDFGAGIRILRQEPWEALCSFIISQCNNIPRIKKIISTLCEIYGEKLDYGLYSFPAAETLAVLSEKDLAPLRCGYRAAYILDAARTVGGGSLDLEALSDMPSEEAFVKIKQIQGVGDKVANCFMLYGLHRMDRFPIDVWMKRALKEHFPKDFDPAVLGSYAGLAQQYIFYYARTHGNVTDHGRSKEDRIFC
ncbi:MAG: DNA-3-methyladenine glycosylase 2 family protein [Clostridiales bacterium]|jgi:N-glycosylase/DNA lyase|nr:DNA-3-methyladenine glycosylase 2 family protein [Clostridiales bacterium]